MIVIKVELWPRGYESRKREIARMHVTNKGTGTATRGDYKIQVMRKGSDDKVQREGEVLNYPRQSYSVWKLIQKALTTVFP
jgi:hypothetical protein